MIAPVVDVGWLREHRDGVVVADVRWYLDGRPGRAAYDAGHLPGAVFVDLDRWLAREATPADGRHPLPDPAVFAEGMSAVGIGDEDRVVAYDDAGGVVAARLVWMLRATGHPAALLDGGLSAWDGPLETATPRPEPARFTAAPWPPERLASMEDAADPANVVLDARDRERYLGLDDPIDPRWGHIPGARSLPCRENLDPTGRLLPIEDLRRRFHAAGIRPSTPVVSYCGSGINACHNLLAIEHAGLGEGRLYPGSWSQWSNDATRPVATRPEHPRDAIELTPIGRVESPLTDPASAPKQGTEGSPAAWLVFEPWALEGLDGIRPGDDVLVLTWLDRADRDVLRVHPRDDVTNPERGVFSTRSADRPNPLGLHRVRVLAVEGRRLRVRDLEALDATPIVDVKPVLGPPAADAG